MVFFAQSTTALRCADAASIPSSSCTALDAPNLSPWTRKKCLKLLYKTCGLHALLPKALKIPICYDRTGFALYRGGFADVWKGEHCGRDVAVKVIRRFCKEVVTWKTLRHPNVLPLIGVTMSEAQFATTSGWVVNGNVNDFVKAHPDVNRLELLVSVARGLIYIHSQGIIHGDLKGVRFRRLESLPYLTKFARPGQLLIDETGQARLADFGLLTIISDPKNLLPSSSYVQGSTARWMSPELIAPHRFGLKNSHPTKSSDCCALGMVIYETISGNLPFHKHTDPAVVMKVVEGERPPRGARFTKNLWETLELCWMPQPNDRPNIEHVLQRIEVASNSLEPPSPRVDEETESDSDSTSNSFGFSNRTGGATVTKRSTPVPPKWKACDQCVITNFPCDGINPCSKCISHKYRCTFVKFHDETGPDSLLLPNDKQVNHNPTSSLDHAPPSDQYLLNNPNNTSITQPGLSGAPVSHHPSTTPPQSDLSFSLYHHSPDSDHSRVREELLHLTGLIDNTSQPPPVITHQQPVRYNQNPDSAPATNLHTPSCNHARSSFSTSVWGTSTPGQDHLDHNNFPHHGRPFSIPQNYSALSDLYDYKRGHLDFTDSDSATAPASELRQLSDHSFYDSPTTPRGIYDNPPAHGNTRRWETKETFSSAFDIADLDDSNTVAGIASHDSPFPSGHNGENLIGEGVLVNLGEINVPDQSFSASGGVGAVGMTPSHDLVEFWKRHIRTPHTGSNPSNTSLPLAAPTHNNIRNQLEAPKPAHVVCLPNVTPPVASDTGLADLGFYGSNEGRNDSSDRPAVNNHGGQLHSHMGTDDLQSNERAALARRTNTNLNLPRKHHLPTAGLPSHSKTSDSTSLSISSPIPPIPQRPSSSSAVKMLHFFGI